MFTRNDLIEKLADTMDRDGARAFVTEVLNAEREPLLQFIRSSKREHHHCEDSWYCCPKCTSIDHGSYGATVAREHAGDVCNCGADAWNTKIEQILNGLPTWICKARATSTDPPQDCDWPTCGCDPYADKVIEALIESGVTMTKG